MNKGFERFTDGKTKEEFLEAYEYNKREGKGQITWNRMMEKMIERETVSVTILNLEHEMNVSHVFLL